MLVVVGLFELRIEFAESLKDKRSVVKSLQHKLKDRFGMSVAEVALQDIHHQARLAFSFVALEHAAADASLERIQAFIESNTDAVVAFWTAEKLEFDETTSL